LYFQFQLDGDPSVFTAPLSMAGVSEKDLKEDHDPFDKNVLKSFTKKKAINTRSLKLPPTYTSDANWL